MNSEKLREGCDGTTCVLLTPCSDCRCSNEVFFLRDEQLMATRSPEDKRLTVSSGATGKIIASIRGLVQVQVQV